MRLDMVDTYAGGWAGWVDGWVGGGVGGWMGGMAGGRAGGWVGPGIRSLEGAGRCVRTLNPLPPPAPPFPPPAADLSLKTLHLFGRVSSKVIADFYFKIDDDVAVNVDALADYLQVRRGPGWRLVVSGC